jgi:hypothetical protein
MDEFPEKLHAHLKIIKNSETNDAEQLNSKLGVAIIRILQP